MGLVYILDSLLTCMNRCKNNLVKQVSRSALYWILNLFMPIFIIDSTSFLLFLKIIPRRSKRLHKGTLGIIVMTSKIIILSFLHPCISRCNYAFCINQHANLRVKNIRTIGKGIQDIQLTTGKKQSLSFQLCLQRQMLKACSGICTYFILTDQPVVGSYLHNGRSEMLGQQQRSCFTT